MASAFIWALIAASSLLVGSLLALWIPISKRTLGVIMGFGAGVLISAVAYELVFEAVQKARLTGYPTLGLFVGAITFFIGDKLIGSMGGSERNSVNASHQSSLVVPLVLGIILDGIPESVVIGLGILGGGTVSFGMLVAVFMSNLPEGIASTTGMRSGGWSSIKIILLWVIIAVVCAVASAIGYAICGGLSHQWFSFILTFSGGAILMMLANTMIPEAYEHGGKLAGIFTVLGFAVSVWVIVLEHSGAG